MQENKLIAVVRPSESVAYKLNSVTKGKKSLSRKERRLERKHKRENPQIIRGRSRDDSELLRLAQEVCMR